MVFLNRVNAYGLVMSKVSLGPSELKKDFFYKVKLIRVLIRNISYSKVQTVML